jgi:GTPase SAR1 family protein
MAAPDQPAPPPRPDPEGSGRETPEADSTESLAKLIVQVNDDATKQELRDELVALVGGRQGQSFHLVVFGTASAGKTSLVNALLGRPVGMTEPVMGTPLGEGPYTHTVDGAEGTLLLTDTPGISSVGAGGEWGEAMAFGLARRADLLLFVVDHDLLRTEFTALSSLVREGKRTVVVLNKKDRFPEADLVAILDKLRERLAGLVPSDDVVAVAAAPRPVLVRVRHSDGQEESVLEYESPDLTALEARVEAILEREGDALRAGSLLLRAYLLRKSAQQQIVRQRRAQAEESIERHQWMAAAAALAVPVPELDMMAAGAVEYRMVSEIASVYGVGLSPAHIRMISVQMVQTLMGRRIVESAMGMVAGMLKSSLIGYAAGGMVQALTIAYLTRITGRTFLDYFERGQDWGEGGMQGALIRQVELSSRSEFFKEFLSQALSRLTSHVSGLWRLVPQAPGGRTPPS